MKGKANESEESIKVDNIKDVRVLLDTHSALFLSQFSWYHALMTGKWVGIFALVALIASGLYFANASLDARTQALTAQAATGVSGFTSIVESKVEALMVRIFSKSRSR